MKIEANTEYLITRDYDSKVWEFAGLYNQSEADSYPDSTEDRTGARYGRTHFVANRECLDRACGVLEIRGYATFYKLSPYRNTVNRKNMKTTLIYKVISEMPLQKTFQRTLPSNNSTLSVFEEEVRKQFKEYDITINHAGKTVTVDVHDYTDEELNLNGDDYSSEI